MPKEETPILSLNGELYQQGYRAVNLFSKDDLKKLLPPLLDWMDNKFKKIQIIDSEIAFNGTGYMLLPEVWSDPSKSYSMHVIYALPNMENSEARHYINGAFRKYTSTESIELSMIRDVTHRPETLDKIVWHNEHIFNGFIVSNVINNDICLFEKMAREIRKLKQAGQDIRIVPGHIAIKNSTLDAPGLKHKHVVYIRPSRNYDDFMPGIEIGNTLDELFEYRSKEIPEKSEKN
jgi:hypothetical protein